MLLDRGAEDNAKDKNGSTPLHIAVSNGQKDIIELLIANGADVNARDKADHTPLSLATNRGHTEIVELLLKYWAKE